jgi:hypothetical protein
MNLIISTATIKELGSNEAIFLAFLKSKKQSDFFEVTNLEIESKLGFSYKITSRLSTKLLNLGYIEIHKSSVHQKTHYKILK